MDSYINIHMRPMPEIPSAHAMEAVFAKLHNALTGLKRDDIGISFPEAAEARPWLGGCLRLHGTQNALDALMQHPWLAGMHDYVAVSPIQPVPEASQFRCIRRVQAKSSPERLRRRHMRRHGVSQEEAEARIPDNAAEKLALPYVHVHSQSTGQKYRLFISHGPVQPAPIQGQFNFYGLSDKATVPWF